LETLTLADLQAIEGTVMLEFGAAWCSHCQAAQTLIGSAIAHYPQIRHIKIEDGKGRRLGRQFRVKLWPTLVFLKNGEEVSRVIRPESAAEIMEQLRRLLLQ